MEPKTLTAIIAIEDPLTNEATFTADKEYTVVKVDGWITYLTGDNGVDYGFDSNSLGRFFKTN